MTEDSVRPWLVKIDDYGNVEWQKTYNNSIFGYGYATSIVEVDDGYIVGAVIHNNSVHSDIFLFKTDFNGNQKWTKIYGGDSGEQIHSIINTSDDGIITVGNTYSFGSGSSDIWLIKTDDQGNELWNKTFGGFSYDIGYDIKETEDNCYVIGGAYTLNGRTWSDVYLLKIDSSGNEIWSQTYGSIIIDDKDSGTSIDQTKEGGYIITGFTHTYGSGDFDVYLIKTDDEGNKLWNLTFGGYAREVGNSVLSTNDGGYIIAGITQTYVSNNDIGDAWLIKLGGDDYPIIEITGGLQQISSKIYNNYNQSMINVNWSIILDGGFIYSGEITNGSIPIISPSETSTILSEKIFGFGKTSIKVTFVTNDDKIYEKRVRGLILFFYVIIY